MSSLLTQATPAYCAAPRKVADTFGYSDCNTAVVGGRRSQAGSSADHLELIAVGAPATASGLALSGRILASTWKGVIAAICERRGGGWFLVVLIWVHCDAVE
jgi:hypothetical protein